MKTHRNVRIYRGVDEAVKLRAAVEVTDGLTACPVCHGGVKLVGLPYDDPELGLKHGDKVYGSHAPGGHRKRRDDVPCVGTYTRPEDEA